MKSMKASEERRPGQLGKVWKRLRAGSRLVYVRATICLVVVLLIFAATGTALDYRRNVEATHDSIVMRGEELGRALSTAAASLVAVRSLDGLQAILNDVAAKQDVVHAWILDRSGKAFRQSAGSPSPEAFSGKAVSVMASRRPGRVYEGNAVVQLQPVVFRNKVVGAIAVRMSLARVEQQQLSSLRTGATLALGTLLLFLPLGAFFMYRVARGITPVTEAANEAAAGFLSTDFPVNSSGEVGDLQRAFRTMIAELRSNIRQIETLASQDAVTKIANRTSFLSTARKAVDLTPRSRGACMMIDITRLAKVIDEHGYAIGDKVMAAAASRLSRKLDELISTTDLNPGVVASFAAHKFSILFPGTTDRQILEKVGDDLVASVSAPYHVENLLLVVGAGVGVALYPEHGATAEEVVRIADTAISIGRAKGVANVYVYTNEDQAAETERERLEEDLWAALDGEEMSVFYQPKVSLETGRIVGGEALLRWTHPELGQIPPGRFIPIAAACGMIAPIGEYVIRRAVRDRQILADQGHDLSVSVNIDPIQFRNPDFATWVIELVKDTGVPAGKLELEISEAMVADDPDLALRHLTSIKEAGIRLALDNFGQNSSRLQDLAEMPFDSLKVDRAFIKDIASSDRKRSVTQLIVSVAKQLNLTAVAEGVETELQRDLIRAWGAEQGQGYLWSPPVDFDSYSSLVLSGNPVDRVAPRSAQASLRA